jgi:hypothetical protein
MNTTAPLSDDLPAEPTSAANLALAMPPLVPGDIEGSWKVVEAMNTQMHDLANAKEWIQMMELAAVRHHRLVEHFEAFPVGPANSEFYRDRMTAMLEGEEQLQQLALEARKEVMRASSISNQNHRAVGAYLNTAAG